ncbi:type III-A CRISPR-associated protein Cas10/Csm1 [Fervidobacterium sp. 2310opik-2]|uniref:type III-A CRISPR-associated protein Cas10/Csm1 n=1 Tax=Fervidobacterium sp. 2310opik-2 TaxID=1755815 RepID=UPI0013DFE738|nr:type III-A CRISPR-associated protein Cas10/Csm1 [Fervidobacterium sp. 2310opik-2]KAF2961057.1 hypothetical protein AS161_03520 [Fervidobacterium sp. 2310opik-2]
MDRDVNALFYLLKLSNLVDTDLQSDEYSDFIKIKFFEINDKEIKISPMRNIFNYLDVSSSNPVWFMPSKYGDYVSCTTNLDDNISKSIERIVGEFRKEVSEFGDNLSFNLADRLVKKYFSFVSFSEPLDQSVSVYQYSKLFALLSGSIRRYCEEENKTLDNLSFSDNVLMLIGGDISGIQSFISNVSSRGALRSYRGRSFFVEFVQEIIVDKLLSACDLSRLNVYFIGGGHFYLIVPNIESFKQKILNAIKEINEWFIDKRLDISVVIDWTEFSLKDAKENLQEVFSTLSKKLRVKKYKSVSIENMKKVFEPLNLRGLEVCRICGRKVDKLYEIVSGSGEKIACDFCRMQYIFGREIMDPENIYIVEEEGHEGFEILGRNYKFVKEISKSGNFKGFKIRNLSEILVNEFDVSPIDVVYYSYSQDLSEIVRSAPGKKLAAFQADVDNLGNFFRNNLKKSSIFISSMVSSLLTYFFKQQIVHILKDKKITLVYAGGDDLFLLGNWKDVVDFSKLLRDEFIKFISSNVLSFSAGCVVFNDREGIKSVKEAVEEAEGIAKGNGKDSIAFTNAVRKVSGKLEKNLTLKWAEFDELYKLYSQAESLATYVDRSLIRKALNISYENTPLAHAYYAYLYARETKEKDENLLTLLMSNYENVTEKDLDLVNAKINLISQFLDLLVRK